MARGLGRSARRAGNGLKRFAEGDGSRALRFRLRFSERFVNLRDNKSGFSSPSLCLNMLMVLLPWQIALLSRINNNTTFKFSRTSPLPTNITVSILLCHTSFPTGCQLLTTFSVPPPLLDLTTTASLRPSQPRVPRAVTTTLQAS